MCVCVHVSGCEVIPERRGRREGRARVGAGISTTAMHVCMSVHVCLSNIIIVSLFRDFQKF